MARGSYITTSTFNPIFNDPQQYLSKRLEILEDHFCIQPSEDQLAYLNTLNTKVAIDNAIMSIMDNYYNN